MSRALAFALAAFVLAVAPLARAQPAPFPTLDAAEAKWQGVFDPDPIHRLEAIARLRADNGISAHVALVDLLLRDPDERVRMAAASAIGHSHNPDLREPLRIASARDPSPWVREAAAQALLDLRPFSKSPRVAGGLALIPGVGHFYLKQPAKGWAYLLSTGALTAGGLLLLLEGDGVGEIGDPSDPNLDANDPIGFLMLAAAQNTVMYSVFDAYRTARLMRGNEGYRLPVSEESLSDLLLAPFSPSVLKSPWVWAGTPLMVAAGVALSLAISDSELPDRNLFNDEEVNFLGRRYGRASGLALGSAYFAGLFSPVGVGEEALFRGVLLPAISESFGVGWGLTLSSLLFGAAHIGNFGGASDYQYKTAAFAVPFITLGGAYMGWVATKHEFTLARSVAIHFWYNFLLSTVDFVLDPHRQPFVARFGTSF